MTLPRSIPIMPDHAHQIAQAAYNIEQTRRMRWGTVLLEQEKIQIEQMQHAQKIFNNVTQPTALTNYTREFVLNLCPIVDEAQLYQNSRVGQDRYSRGAWWLANQAGPTVGLNLTGSIEPEEATSILKTLLQIEDAVREYGTPIKGQQSLDQIVEDLEARFYQTLANLRTRFLTARETGEMLVLSTVMPNFLADLIAEAYAQPDYISIDEHDLNVTINWVSKTLATYALENHSISTLDN